LRFKAKAKTKDMINKAKAYDLTFKAKDMASRTPTLVSHHST